MTQNTKFADSNVIVRTLLAGACARCCAATIMFPVDVIKTRMQFQRGKPVDFIRTHYSSGWDAFKKILKTEPLSAFYRGLPIRLLYIAPSAAVSFTVYEQFKAAVNSDHENKLKWTTPVITLAAGVCARILGTAVRTPFDMLKQQMQIQGQLKTRQFKGIIDSIKWIQKNYGVTGFFQGYKITLLRDAPFAGIYFTTYEISKYYTKKITNVKALNHLLSGAIAGAIATTITIPIDFVKTRLQTQRTVGVYQYNGIIDAFKTIYIEEGKRAFFRGLGPRLAYIIPASALTFTFFEWFKIKFRLNNGQQKQKIKWIS